MKKYFLVLSVLIITTHMISAQTQVSGTVYEKDNNNHKHVLTGVNIYWSGTTDGTVSDDKGHFSLERPCPMHRFIVISYVGYLNDTIDLDIMPATFDVILNQTQKLQEVTVSARSSGTYISRKDPIFKEVITTGELQKAACCNLAESFETNASVDVSYSDAVTGAKQIQLLGLSGIYSQILSENIPMLKGPAIPYGLLYVPGPWMESIQISKGTSSVINGYESITGQINVEFKKPETSEKLFVNIYTNDFGRSESSITSAVKLSKHWHAMLMVHGEYLNKRNDMNKDGFIDHPLATKYNIFNRYRYDKPGVMESMFGFRMLSEEKLAGQMSYKDKNAVPNITPYGVDINTKRYEVFAKNGFFTKKQGTSIGTIIAGSLHEQESKFGNNIYDVVHKNVYSNIIYESQIFNHDHKINAGGSFTYDHYNETIINQKYIKEEVVPGVFAQYTYNKEHLLSAIGGIRYDHHSIYGNFITPRLHTKYDINHRLTLRASGGKGYRSPNILAENPFLLMTSRTINIANNIKAEEAWNYGGSLTYNFEVFKNESDISIEYYRTDFINQTIIDFERSIKDIYIYNLAGRSYSNSLQVVFNTSPTKGLDFTAAYRWNDVKTTLNGQLLPKPLVNAYKGLLSMSYLTPNNHWQFDFTAQFNGKSRLPNTKEFPEAYRRPDFSPTYTIINSQLTYKAKSIDVYIGGENLTSFMQHHPIISAGDPFGDYFDTSSIWGPIMPRTFYVGLRASIK